MAVLGYELESWKEGAPDDERLVCDYANAKL